MEKVITICLIIVGFINFAPVIGVLSVQKLESAYAISVIGNDLAILMRHRAILFGILGGFILYSAFNPMYQWAAMIMGGVSLIGFAILVLSVGGYNETIGKALSIDIVAILILLVAVVMKYATKAS